jgi:hypothetical protein
MQASGQRRKRDRIGWVLGVALAGVLAWASAPTGAQESAAAGAEESAATGAEESAATGAEESAATGAEESAKAQESVVPVALERQGCIAQPEGRPSRSGERFGDELRVTSREGSLLLEHGLAHRCCHSVDVEVSASEGKVRFFEVWDGEGCRCWCSSRITARTDRLPPGEYAVEVVTARRGGPPEKRLQILAETVTVE